MGFDVYPTTFPQGSKGKPQPFAPDRKLALIGWHTKLAIAGVKTRLNHHPLETL